MRKYFVTGLIILLPLALTLVIAMFFVNLLTKPFLGLVQALFDHYGLLGEDFYFITSAQAQYIVSRLLVLLFLFFATVLLGVFAHRVFFHYVIKAWDALFHRIPFISTIYRTSQDVVKTIFTTDTKSFKQVVLVPFPNEETRSVGLITNATLPDMSDEESDHLVAVFVPTTPNPTSGFLMLFKQADIVYLDMRIEDAFKYIISCGVIRPPFNKSAEPPVREAQ